MTYRSTDKGTYKGKDISGEFRWIDVFANRGGRWRVVVSQERRSERNSRAATLNGVSLAPRSGPSREQEYYQRDQQQ